MHDDPADSDRFVSADRPINRRTASGTLPPPERAPNPILQDKLQRLQGRKAMGVPLAQSLRVQPRAQPSGRRLSGYVGLGAGVIGAVLGLAIAAPPLSYLGAAAGCSLAAASAFWGLRPTGRSSGTWLPMAALLDGAQLSALDNLLETLAPELPPAQLATLQQFKSTLVNVATQTAQEAPEAWSAQDQAWLQQAVGRYLPDTLQAYLDIAPEQRARSLNAQGQNAHQLLQSQLDSLLRQLTQLQGRLQEQAANRLLIQDRFLQAKERKR